MPRCVQLNLVFRLLYVFVTTSVVVGTRQDGQFSSIPMVQFLTLGLELKTTAKIDVFLVMTTCYSNSEQQQSEHKLTKRIEKQMVKHRQLGHVNRFTRTKGSSSTFVPGKQAEIKKSTILDDVPVASSGVPRLSDQELHTARATIAGSNYIKSLPESEQAETVVYLLEALGLDVLSQTEGRKHTVGASFMSEVPATERVNMVRSGAKSGKK